ncbi:MAG TPA: DUF4062 domain-containing protein [Desulfosporosinus sp.]
MAGLRIFVSSTCYDLSVIRSELRTFIQALGHEPVMSDYSDILYDPSIHTHTSCVDEVATVDVVVLIVGSRFGGKTVPEALGRIDFDILAKESKSIESLKLKNNLSVTQLEVLKAVENGIPVFTFIDSNVSHDHALYEKNKDKAIISQILFPSIEKAETAIFIFEFINFLRHRTRGNSVFTFSKVQDIEEVLRKQWSSLFQKFLQEQRGRATEARRIDKLTEQFEDLKTAILTSIGTTNEREVARGVVRFRRLIDFVRSLVLREHNFLIRGKHSWDELLEYAGIEKIIDSSELSEEFLFHLKNNFGSRSRLFLIKRDGTFYEFRGSHDSFHNMRLEWDAFVELTENTREVIVDALTDMGPVIGPLKYIKEPFNYYIDRQLQRKRMIQVEIESETDESERVV